MQTALILLGLFTASSAMTVKDCIEAKSEPAKAVCDTTSGTPDCSPACKAAIHDFIGKLDGSCCEASDEDDIPPDQIPMCKFAIQTQAKMFRNQYDDFCSNGNTSTEFWTAGISLLATPAITSVESTGIPLEGVAGFAVGAIFTAAIMLVKGKTVGRVAQQPLLA